MFAQLVLGSTAGRRLSVGMPTGAQTTFFRSITAGATFPNRTPAFRAAVFRRTPNQLALASRKSYFRKCAGDRSTTLARRTARLSQALRTSLLAQQQSPFQVSRRYLGTFAESPSSSTSNIWRDAVIRKYSPTFLYIIGAVTASGIIVGYTPLFKHTREGFWTAWNWSRNGDHYASRIAEAWVWQFWIGLVGLFAGFSATRNILAKSIQQPHGSWLIPFKIPASVFGGVLGAKLTASTAAPVAEFVVFVGRLAEFLLDGLAADLFGKPRKELSWVVQQEQRALNEVKEILKGGSKSA